MKTKISLSALVLLMITLVVIACKKLNLSSEREENTSKPMMPENPDDYKASFNDHLAALGRVLFYDKNLSINNSVSCGSCHQQARAFCDNQQFSTGVEDMKTTRNTPSIFAKQSSVFWDGRASNLRDLALRPVKNHVEMKFENLIALSAKLSSISYYPILFKRAFPSETEIDSSMIQMALAEFLLNFDFSNNKFSKSRSNKAILNVSETLGETVFFGKGRCSQCHHIENNRFFPNDSTANMTGYGSTHGSHNIGLNTVYADNGIGALTQNHFKDGEFMIPALLNVEYTAPYMHDGRFKTLEDVVEHYNSGIQDHPNLDMKLRAFDFESINEAGFLSRFDLNHNGFIDNFEIKAIPPVKLGLSPSEKKGLVDFLKTLSDPQIKTEYKFSNPFSLN